MNKTYVYGIVAIALVVVLFVSASSVVKEPLQEGDVITVTGGGQNTAAVAQSITVGKTVNIAWDPDNFPADQVSVKIIRKVNDNPASYELVKFLETATGNDGSTTWTPSAGEIGDNLFVEVGCVSPLGDCRASISPFPLSVR